MLQAIEATIYRAGTSRGPYFLADDLPSDKEELDQALLSIMGSGHPLQIDGLGGGNTLTSKVAVVSRSHAPDLYDVDYLFCQVGIAERVVDKGPNCGNMMTGVASFAVERGLVQPDPSATEWVIRVFNINTKQVSELSLPVQNGRVHYDSVDEDGILRPCARVGLRFLDTAGACTGTLLPTGKPFDIIHGIRVSILDSAVPVVFIRQDDVGIAGDESSTQLNQNLALLETLERIRLEAGLRMGLGDVSGSVLPKLSLLRPGRATTTFTARYFTPKTCHNAHAVTGAICTAGAAFTPGTIVWEMYQEQQRAGLSTSSTPVLQTPSLSNTPESSTRSSFSSDSGYVEPKLQQTRRISIEHPSGTIDVGLSSSGESLSTTDIPKDLGVAFVERTVALIAHARIYYLTPEKPQAVKKQRLPVLSPEITAFPSAKAQDYFSSRQRKQSTGIPTELQPLTAIAARGA